MLLSLGIFDLEQSKVNFMNLTNHLNITQFKMFTDISEEETLQYQSLIFVLNPQSIGNEMFLTKIEQLLKKRKNTKTYYFIIDAMHDLDRRERMKVEVELESALANYLANPNIVWMDSNYASIYQDFKMQEILLSDIQKNKSIRLVDHEGYQVSGQAITLAHVDRLWELSNIETVIHFLNEHISKLGKTDITKMVWAVAGNPNSGKTTFNELLEMQNDHVRMIELDDWEDYKNHSIEGLVLLLDYNHNTNKTLLNSVVSEMIDIPIKVIVNKADCYMYSKQDRYTFCKSVQEYVKKITGEEVVAFLSCYHVSEWYKYKQNERSVDEMMGDKELIILDEFDLPLIVSNKEEFINKFEKQNYTKEIKKVEQELCLKTI